ncbi:hypothetical protein Brsp02_00941 [Brucella sp. NBRC 113783]
MPFRKEISSSVLSSSLFISILLAARFRDLVHYLSEWAKLSCLRTNLR